MVTPGNGDGRPRRGPPSARAASRSGSGTVGARKPPDSRRASDGLVSSAPARSMSLLGRPGHRSGAMHEPDGDQFGLGHRHGDELVVAGGGSQFAEAGPGFGLPVSRRTDRGSADHPIGRTGSIHLGLRADPTMSCARISAKNLGEIDYPTLGFIASVMSSIAACSASLTS